METTKKRQQRREQQRKNRRNRKIFIATFGLALFVGLVAIYIIFAEDVYQDKDSFDQYAERYFSETYNSDNPKPVTSFGQPLSTAIDYPKIKYKRINDQMNTSLDRLVQRYKLENKTTRKEDQFAMFVHTKTYLSPKATLSMIAFEEQQKKDNRSMEPVKQKIYTYNFSTETGLPLTANQIFNQNYRSFCSEYISNYLTRVYGPKIVKEKRDKTLAVNEKNFNQFILTKKGVTFYFDQDTLTDEKDKGQIKVNISYKALDGVIRDKILKRYIDPKKPMVALTYDDGPAPGPSNRILDCLEKHGVVATFFELGRNVKAHPDVVRREYALGMEIGSHSWSHPDLKKSKDDKVKKQLDDTNKELLKATGQVSTVFRPPYGNTNANVQKYAKAPVILWSVDTLDWKSRKATSVVNVVKGVKNLDGRVILMHSLYDSSAQATEQIVPYLLSKGYQLVTVSELLEYKYKETPKNGKLYGYGYFYLDK